MWDREAGGVKVFVSRDVIFNENVFPCKSTNKDAGTNAIIQSEFNLTGGGAQFEVEPNAGLTNQHHSVQVTPVQQVTEGDQDPVQADEQSEEEDDQIEHDLPV